MATVTLICFIVGDEPLSTHFFLMEIPPSKMIGIISQEIWGKKPKEWQELNPFGGLVLYTPKTPISTLDEVFNVSISQLKLDTPEGRADALIKLNLTYRIEDYPTLKTPAKKQLHIIVLPPSKVSSTSLSPSSMSIYLLFL
jgi:hypothetical protein